MLLAAKFEEADGFGVSITELREHLEYTYTKELFIEMEAAVLTALDWRPHDAHPVAFLLALVGNWPGVRLGRHRHEDSSRPTKIEDW